MWSATMRLAAARPLTFAMAYGGAKTVAADAMVQTLVEKREALVILLPPDQAVTPLVATRGWSLSRGRTGGGRQPSSPLGSSRSASSSTTST